MNRNSLLRKTPIILVVILLLMLSTITVIASMPVESFPLTGTFKYAITLFPIFEIDATNKSHMKFAYFAQYEIVESQFAQLAKDKLRVFSGYSDAPNEANFYVAVTYFWINAPNSSTYWSANSLGIVPPYQTENYCLVDLTDLISRYNIINDTLGLQWTLSFQQIVATFDQNARAPDYGRTLRPAGVESTLQQEPHCAIFVQVMNGVPVEIVRATASGNETIGSSLPKEYDFNRTEWTFQSSIDVLNPSVLQAKDSLPYLLVASIILLVAVPTSYHYSKPKQV